MAMVINTNMAALNAVRTLDATGRDQSTAMERLTSGLRINSAADDAAGLAVSDRMSVQIRGTEQAVRNTNDGISVAQTIDGAAGELVNMMERMRELGIQSMNDTYTDENRLQMDQEFQQLKAEIDRVAETTKFNGRQVMANADGIDIQAGWQTSGNDQLTINTLNMATSAIGDQFDYDTADMAAPTPFVAGETISLDIGDVFSAANPAILAAPENVEVTYGDTVNGVLVQTAEQANEAIAYEINTNDKLQDAGFYATVDQTNGSLNLRSSEGDLDPDADPTLGDIQTNGATNAANLGAVSAGDDFKVSGVDTLHIKTKDDSKVSVDSIDTALTDINNYRANLGAVQNRMEYTVANLNSVNENMNAARSQILDADFAKESAELARTQVLEQAGMSMLSQANQQSQNVLQLLQ